MCPLIFWKSPLAKEISVENSGKAHDGLVSDRSPITSINISK